MRFDSLAGLAIVFALGTSQLACAAPTSEEEEPGEAGGATDESGRAIEESDAPAPEVGVSQQALTTLPTCIKITREWFSYASDTNYWTVRSTCHASYRAKIDVAVFTDSSCATVKPGQTVTYWKFYVGGVDVHGRGVKAC